MAGFLDGKNVLLGVGGGIAAYKAVELCRAMQKEGASVRVAMTHSATAFIPPLTFASLTRQPVLHDVLSLGPDGTIDHVEWGHWAHLMIVAPATADLIARLAAGMANDGVTSVALCLQAPLVLCPAMEPHMWANAVTRRNIESLRALVGAQIVQPEEGPLASGRSGMGRLASPQAMLDGVRAALRPQDLRGKRVLVTAGATQEPIDPVRFISNGSTGKMGVSLAEAARARGADVTLIHAPLSVSLPSNVALRPVKTALQMLEALKEELVTSDVLIMAAAVSDFRPAQVHGQKVKKGADVEKLELVANPDLLMSTKDLNARCIRVGFAAETEKIREHALDKLRRKGLHFIVANDVSQPDAGFAVDTNRVVILDGKGEEALPLMKKGEVAHAVLDRVVKLLAQG